MTEHIVRHDIQWDYVVMAFVFLVVFYEAFRGDFDVSAVATDLVTGPNESQRTGQ